MATRLRGRCGYPADDPFRVTGHPARLYQPFRWKKPRRIFVCSMGDLFHEDVTWWYKENVMYACLENPQHTFIVLTKRPERMQNFLASFYNLKKIEHPIQNLWLGVTAENQQRADERIPILLQIPAAKQFVSIEPMLGPVDIYQSQPRPFIDWIIVGGESGPGARPMHPDWARSVRDQCVEASVPFFFKQWGEWLPDDFGTVCPSGATPKRCWIIPSGEAFDYSYPYQNPVQMMMTGKKAAGRLLDGREWKEMP